MAGAGRLRTKLRGCFSLCILLLIFCSLDQAQQPASASAQTAQVQPGANASDSSAGSERKISGLAVIVKIASVDGDPLFYADGYRIRVQPGTVTVFSASLKNLSAVTPGVWIHFEGERDDAGTLVASKAEFFSAGSRKAFKAMGPRKAKHAPDYQPITHDVLVDAEGNFAGPHTKVRLSDAGGLYGWHRVPADPAMQERVERIGMQVVPAFQKQLPHNNPARIPFRFYAVDDDKIRSVFACDVGLILVPRNVVERMQSDDQLASVLADGVAFNLERQLVSISTLDVAAGGSEVLALIPTLFPEAYIAGDAAYAVIEHEWEAKLRREIARTSLQLVADAGFDPWQAPEAWRLLDPRDLPRDTQSLKYTTEGKYQLSILRLQYKKDVSGPSAGLPASASGKSDQ